MTVSSNERDLTKFAVAIQQLEQGRSNAAGICTLATGGTTTVKAPNCAATSKVLLFPRSASAAAELGSGTLYVSAVGNGTFTLTHAGGPPDRSFAFVCLG